MRKGLGTHLRTRKWIVRLLECGKRVLSMMYIGESYVVTYEWMADFI